MRMFHEVVDRETSRIRSLAVTMIFVLWLCGVMSFCAGFLSADYLAQHVTRPPAASATPIRPRP